MTFLSLKERLALGSRNPREEVVCPVCEGKAERQRNGKWQCVESEKQDTSFWNGLSLSILTCGARGVTLSDDLVPTSKPSKVENEDTSLSDSSRA